jgi:hypothetical protein
MSGTDEKDGEGKVTEENGSCRRFARLVEEGKMLKTYPEKVAGKK